MLATTAPGHLAGNPGVAAEAGLLYRTPAQGSVDGNTVNMDAERAAFADNAVHYEFNLTRITQQIGGSFGVAVLAVALETAGSAGDRLAAFHQAFWWAVGITALAFVACLWLPGRRPAVASDESVPDEAELEAVAEG